MIECVPVVGEFSENCYFFIDAASKHGFAIDPGAQASRLLALIAERGWTIEKILLTHGHFDHIGAASELREALGVPILAFANAREYLADPAMNLSAYQAESITVDGVLPFEDGQRISLAANPAHELTVLHTPGHTSDSVTFFAPSESAAFVGDTIFAGSIGNYRFPGGSYGQIRSSILEKILKLPAETVLLPGHGPQTSVLAERMRYGLAT